MKKFITLASAGLLLFSLQAARAQKEVAPPAIPPLLEGSKPLAQPETREPAAPKQPDQGKAKPKTKAKTTATAGKKTQKKAVAKKVSAKKVERQETRQGLQEKKPEKPREETTGSRPQAAG